MAEEDEMGVAVYDAGSSTITVSLVPILEDNTGELVDFSRVGDGVRGVKKLVIVGSVVRGNFTSFNVVHPWHVHFVPNPTIDLSLATAGLAYQNNSSLWRTPLPRERGCLLPLGDLAPAHVLFPLGIVAISGFGKRTRSTSGSPWDLSKLKTTNLQDLDSLETIAQSFNSPMPLLEEMCLPPNLKTVRRSFLNMFGGPDNDAVWECNPFDKCLSLACIETSFCQMPWKECLLQLPPTPNRTIRVKDSFNLCPHLADFVLIGGGSRVDITSSIQDNPSLKSLALCGVTQFTNSVCRCANLATLNLGDTPLNGDGTALILESFNELGILHITVPAETTRINSAFRQCRKLRTVMFATNGSPPRSNVADIGAGCFSGCDIDLVHHLEHTQIINMYDGCFSGNPLRHIAAPATVVFIDPSWASHLLPSINGGATHLDLSRVRDLETNDDQDIDSINPEGRGFDNIWLGFDQAWVRREGVGDILWKLLVVYAHNQTVVHCRKGNSKDMKQVLRQSGGADPSQKFGWRDVLGSLTWINSAPSKMGNPLMSLMMVATPGAQQEMWNAVHSLEHERTLNVELPYLSRDLQRLILQGAYFKSNYQDPVNRPHGALVGAGAGGGDFSTPIRHWSVDQVAAWLVQFGLSAKSMAVFRDFNVDGKSLTLFIAADWEADGMLQDDFHVLVKPRRTRLVREITKLAMAQPPAETAEFQMYQLESARRHNAGAGAGN
jgi:hypothetical protein